METEHRRAEAVRKAIQESAVSIRTLASEAGVSDTLIRLIRDEERTPTPAVVSALADALQRLADRHASAARRLRDTLPGEATE